MLQNEKISKISDFAMENDSDILITHYSSNKMCISYVLENINSIKFYKNLYNILSINAN